MHIEDRIKELEEGFRDLFEGLRILHRELRDDAGQVTQILKQEIAVLKGIIEEYRHQPTRRDPIAVSVQMPSAVTPRLADVVAPFHEMGRIRKKQPKKPIPKIDKPCERCGNLMVGVAKTRKFCNGCFRIVCSERMKKLQDEGRVPRILTRNVS